MKNKSLILLLIIISLSWCIYGRVAAESANNKTASELIDQTIEAVNNLKIDSAKQPAVAAEVENPASSVLIDLDFNEANLEDVLRIIGEADGRNIVLDPALKGRKTSIHLKKVTSAQALGVIYSSYGLGSSSIGNVLFVSTQDKVKKSSVKSQVVALKNVNSEDVRALLNNVVSTVNIGKEVNSLVLVGASEDVDNAVAILRKVDVPQLQVLLEAKIIEINTDAERDLGIDYPDSVTFTMRETKRPLTLADTAAKIGPPGTLFAMDRSAISFDIALKMLEKNNKAKILSSPKVTTMNNKEAEIFVGDKIPYTINSVAGGVASTEVRFVEPGIRLKITPSIIDQDFVTIKVQPEVSYIYSFRGANDEYPWVKSRQATAYVRVKNGQPFVLGGLLSNEDKKNVYGLPILGKLPLLGNLLFSHEDKIHTDSDLIITVVPKIISE